MAASTKTLLVGAALALAVALFTMQAARAGDYQRLPFTPFNAGQAMLGDDDHDDMIADYRMPRVSPEIDAAVSTATGVARQFLDDDHDDNGVFPDFDD